MSMLLLKPDTSPNVPYRDVSLHNVVRRRGQFLMGGPPVANWLGPDAYVAAADALETPVGLPDFMRGIGFVVVSHRFMRVLKDAKAEVEFFPIPLVYQCVRRQGFFIMIPLLRVRAIDRERSSIELDDAEVALSVKSLVLDESSFGEAPLVYVHEIAGVAVQQWVAEALLAAGCSGCAFIAPSTFRL